MTPSRHRRDWNPAAQQFPLIGVCYSFGRKRTEGCPGGGAVTNRLLHKRREFITLLGGAAATWPLAARAQQGERMRRVGVLLNLAANDPMGQARVAALARGLQATGWSDGRNVRIDTRWAAADPGNYRKYAVELMALGPDVILASRPIHSD